MHAVESDIEDPEGDAFFMPSSNVTVPSPQGRNSSQIPGAAGVVTPVPVVIATQPAVRLPVPDGLGSYRYPAPNINLFVFDPSTGYRFDTFTGLYYEANSGYFINNTLNVLLRWDAAEHTYLRVFNFAESGETSGQPVSHLGGTDDDRSVSSKSQAQSTATVTVAQDEASLVRDKLGNADHKEHSTPVTSKNAGCLTCGLQDHVTENCKQSSQSCCSGTGHVSTASPEPPTKCIRLTHEEGSQGQLDSEHTQTEDQLKNLREKFSKQKCFACGLPTHAGKCKIGTKICHNCNQRGHLSGNCPEPWTDDRAVHHQKEKPQRRKAPKQAQVHNIHTPLEEKAGVKDWSGPFTVASSRPQMCGTCGLQNQVGKCKIGTKISCNSNQEGHIAGNCPEPEKSLGRQAAEQTSFCNIPHPLEEKGGSLDGPAPSTPTSSKPQVCHACGLQNHDGKCEIGVKISDNYHQEGHLASHCPEPWTEDTKRPQKETSQGRQTPEQMQVHNLQSPSSSSLTATGPKKIPIPLPPSVSGSSKPPSEEPAPEPEEKLPFENLLRKAEPSNHLMIVSILNHYGIQHRKNPEKKKIGYCKTVFETYRYPGQTFNPKFMYRRVMDIRKREPLGYPFPHGQATFPSTEAAKTWFEHFTVNNTLKQKDKVYYIFYTHEPWVCPSCEKPNFFLRRLCFYCCRLLYNGLSPIREASEPSWISITQVPTHVTEDKMTRWLSSRTAPFLSVKMIKDPCTLQPSGIMIVEPISGLEKKVFGILKTFEYTSARYAYLHYTAACNCQLKSVESTPDQSWPIFSSLQVESVRVFKLCRNRTVALVGPLPASKTKKNCLVNIMDKMMNALQQGNFLPPFATNVTVDIWDKDDCGAPFHYALITMPEGIPPTFVKGVFTFKYGHWYDEKVQTSYTFASLGNWKCNSCKFANNFPLRSICLSCGYPKRGSPVIVFKAQQSSRWVAIFGVPLSYSEESLLDKVAAGGVTKSSFKSMQLIKDPKMGLSSGICLFEADSPEGASKLEAELKEQFPSKVQCIDVNEKLLKVWGWKGMGD